MCKVFCLNVPPRERGSYILTSYVLHSCLRPKVTGAKYSYRSIILKLTQQKKTTTNCCLLNNNFSFNRNLCHEYCFKICRAKTLIIINHIAFAFFQSSHVCAPVLTNCDLIYTTRDTTQMKYI